MKSGLLLAMAVCISRLATAAPCTSSTLDQYIALGNGGCSIGTNTVFGFNELMGQFGATQIAPTSIFVSTSGGTFSPTIQFATPLTVSFPNFDEALITYRIKGASYLREMNSLAGTSSSNGGDATSVQNYCVNGVFSADGVTGCPGDPSGTHNVLVNFNNDTQSATFTSALSLSITDDLVLDASGGGRVVGGTLTDSFVAAPEPTTWLLTGLGMFGALMISRMRPASARLREAKNE